MQEGGNVGQESAVAAICRSCAYLGKDSRMGIIHIFAPVRLGNCAFRELP